MYKIKIKDIEIFGYHGFYQHEKESGQNFIINIEYIPNINVNNIKDDITKTIDYISIVEFFNKEFNAKRFNLIESLAADLMNKVNNSFTFKYFRINILKKIESNPGFSVEIILDNE